MQEVMGVSFSLLSKVEQMGAYSPLARAVTEPVAVHKRARIEPA